MNAEINESILIEWLESAIISNEPSVSADIDHFFTLPNKDSLQPMELFETGCEIFAIVSNLMNIKFSNFDKLIFMTIDLVSLSSSLIPQPESVNEIVLSIDGFSMPELFVYTSQAEKDFPYNDFHRIPINFKIANFSDYIKVIYKQVRSFENMLSNANYDRDITFYLDLK